MAGKIKGITLEIGGDTTGLSKALSDVNKKTRDVRSELRAVEQALKLDPKNTEILAQKQNLLAKNIETTETKLEALKKAKADVDKRMASGDTQTSAEQYRALQREILKTEKALEDLSDESEKTGKELKSIGTTGKSVSELKSIFGTVAKGAAGFGAAVVGVAAGLSQLEAETREYREDVNKLNAAFVAAKKSPEDAKKAFSDFYGLLGEDDRAIEAVNHLAELTNNQKELSDWTLIAAGVNAKFTDSLPIEGLTEAANETAKVGQVTGVLADALNWAGESEDKFNEKLEKLKTEEERAALITETLNGLYAETGKQYMEMNASTIANREAQQHWNDTMAKVGEIVAPVKAQIIEFGAKLLDNVVTTITAKSETEKLVEAIRAENEAYREAKIAQEEKTSAAVAEIDYTTRLYHELKTLADENGNVNEANRLRVEYILGELNEALGLELKLTGDQIKGYQDLSSSIEEMLAKKRAEIILASQEESYKAAIVAIDEKRAKQSELYIKILEKEAQYEKLAAEKNKAGAVDRAKAMSQIRGELAELQAAYEENDTVINEYYGNIADYESNYAALLSGNAENIKQINNSVGESFKIAGEATEDELEKQVMLSATKYAEMQKKVDEGVKGVTQTMADEALIQYQNACTEYEKIGKAIPEGMQVGIDGGKPFLKSKIGSFIAELKTWFTKPLDINSPSGWAEEIAEFVDEGLALGLIKNKEKVRRAFKDVVEVFEEEHEDLTEEEQHYQGELLRIQTEGTEEQNKEYLKGLEAQAEAAKKHRQQIREIYQGMVEDVQKRIAALHSEMTSYKNGLSSVNLIQDEREHLLFELNGEKFTRTEERKLADLSGKVQELEAFYQNLLSLEEIGIDESMIEQIKKLGGENGAILAEELLQATPEQRDKFVSDFKKIGELSGKATAEVYKDEIQTLAVDTKNLFTDLNPDMLKVGEDWGTLLGSGIVTKLKETLSGLGGLVSFAGTVPGGNVYQTTINQQIWGGAGTVVEIEKKTRRTMENIGNWGVLA
ncbi:MAG: hypothetical protein E7397_04585 [Ruminococcaceae bacterium]|nr:hypothetical protein [Oscillospiraceae bacterium]